MSVDNVAALNARDDLLELAERYETVKSLDLTPAPAVGRTAPGSRLPPGMQEVLDQDEILQAVTAVDEWAEFLAHVIADEREVSMPDATPARLREVAKHIAHLIGHEDEMLALSVADDLHTHLKAIRRLCGRAVRRVRTGVRCQMVTCSGYYVSPLGAVGDRHDDALECDKCKHRVPHSVWSSWPKARVKYVTVEHAANMVNTTVAAIKMRAARAKWRRVGTGRDVRYHVDDVRGESA